jgi:hypothetical protein
MNHRPGFRVVPWLSLMLMVLVGCEGDQGPIGPAGPPGGIVQSNDTCLNSDCHGNADLVKTIINDQGNPELVPLFVDEAAFGGTVHGDQLCVSCHSDINATGGAHGPVDKTYGGWARFSRKQPVEEMGTNDVVRTRNYYTAASKSCVTCHAEHSGFQYSAHATIFKHREARIDAELSAVTGVTIGEDYTVGDCNRCHASCSTCHFKSSISRLTAGDAYDFWSQNQASYPAPGFNDAMTEFKMDWTTNVATHDFRTGSYFDHDTEGVCESCHTGFYKPAGTAYYWTNEEHTEYGSLRATNVKRHPQLYELQASGDASLPTGGSNAAHASFTCADCHGSTVGDVHALPGLPYFWETDGDVQCVDCHATTHTNAMVALHMDGTGTDVACIGCHSFGLARDYELATVGSSTSVDVFLDSETGQVRPVVFKHGHAVAWYPHNWQTLAAGTGVGDQSSDCAKKCHYDGNPIGASAW